jgi:hypothetical protein
MVDYSTALPVEVLWHSQINFLIFGDSLRWHFTEEEFNIMPENMSQESLGLNFPNISHHSIISSEKLATCKWRLLSTGLANIY